MRDHVLVILLTIVVMAPIAAIGGVLIYALFLSLRRHRGSFTGRMEKDDHFE